MTYADRLISHLQSCPQCRRAISNRRRGRLCPIGRELIKKTLDERHPLPEGERP